jgi:serine-type D-Ala-D-Ala carboxypeptidase (penicillin-binding protein 5/6)
LRGRSPRERIPAGRKDRLVTKDHLQSWPVLRRAPLVAVIAVAAALATPVQASTAQDGPRIDAEAWYLVGQDGVVLAQSNSRRARAIASITKLMTTIVALEHARPSDVVRVPASVAILGGSTIFLQGGEELRVSELVRATLIPSANDAATALALHVGEGSTERFVDLMNAKAAELGLTDTTFENPHGLDSAGHLSSARDATLLVRHALGIPILRDALGRTSFAYQGRDFPSTDDLNGSWGPLIGGKTGHTESAGWSETAGASARGATVFGTVLGGDSRADRNDALRTLLSFGLARYRVIAAIDSTRVYATAETGYGRSAVDLVAPRTIRQTVHERASLVERVIAQRSVDLPIRRGQVLGRVEVWDGDTLLASSNLVAAADVTEPGVFGKASWFLRATASNLWGLVS